MCKETTFIKQVERTAKRDAYLLAHEQMEAGVYTKEDVLKYLKDKADGHTEFLNELPFEYDYSSQSLREKRFKKQKLEELREILLVFKEYIHASKEELNGPTCTVDLLVRLMNLK